MKIYAKFYNPGATVPQEEREYICHSLKEAKGEAIYHAWEHRFSRIVLSKQITGRGWLSGEKLRYMSQIAWFDFGNGYWETYK